MTTSSPPATQGKNEAPDSLSPEMKEKVRTSLMKWWEYNEMQQHRKILTYIWSHSIFDQSSSFLPRNPISNDPSVLQPEQLQDFCNNTTALYLMPSAQMPGGRRRDCLLLLACIFKEWLLQHPNNSPNIEYDQFFTCLFQIPSQGPKYIKGIIESHRAVCRQALSFFVHIRNGEGRKFDKCVAGPWKYPERYSIKPLYCAIIMVMDEYLEPARDENDPFRILDLSKHSEQQTVLLVRTGQESELTAPITFDGLRASGKCLPFSRPDLADSKDANTVRVSLQTAVAFISELERRENTVNASKGDDGYCDGARKWADELLSNAEEKGISKVPLVEHVAEKIMAADYDEEKFAEQFNEPQIPFCRFWE